MEPDDDFLVQDFIDEFPMDVEVNEPGDILDGSNDYSEVLDTVVADDPNVQYLIQMANGGNLLTGMSYDLTQPNLSELNLT